MTPGDTVITSDMAICEHTYDLTKASRDDQGYYLDCTKCHQPAFFQCDTWDELLQMFGIDNDEDAYDYRHNWDDEDDEDDAY